MSLGLCCKSPSMTIIFLYFAFLKPNIHDFDKSLSDFLITYRRLFFLKIFKILEVSSLELSSTIKSSNFFF